MKHDVPSAVSFGETMIRLSTKNFERIEQARELEVTIGGAESNFAIAFARLGGRAAWISKLTDNPLGRLIVNRIREHGVDISHIIWTKEYRVGLYFIEFGRTPRPINVIYDRKDSAISNINPNEVDWNILGDYDVFHTTGITVALSENCAKAVNMAIKKAKELNTLVSFDVNYRSKLWTPKEAFRGLDPMLSDTDILFVTKSDARLIFKISGSNEDIARRLYERYRPDILILTLGSEGAMAFDGEKIYYAQPYKLEIVDRIGAGDAFDAGFVFRYLETNDVESALEWGSAMAALAHTIPGDPIYVTKEEVEEVIRKRAISDIVR